MEVFLMNPVEIILGVVLLLFSMLIIVVVLLQEGQQQNLGTVDGGSDTFLSKNRSRSIDSAFERWTKIISIGFFLLVIAANIILAVIHFGLFS